MLPLLALGQERNEPNTGIAETNLLSLSYGRIIPKSIDTSEGLLPESFDTYQIVCPGDIVFRLTDLQNDKRSLRTALVREKGIITFAYVAFQPWKMLPAFLDYLLRSYDAAKLFYTMGGGVRQSMKYADIKRLPMLVPEHSEQIAIIEFLDRETGKIDALVKEQRRLIELLKEKRQAVISHAVTKGLDPNAPMKDSGVEFLGHMPAHWSLMPMAARYSIQLGKMLDTAKVTGNELRPYLRVLDVQWGCINTSELPEMDFDVSARKRFRLVPGDLLVNEGGSYPGRSAIWTEPIECYYQKALHRLRTLDKNLDNSRFLFYLMFWATHMGVFTAGGNEATIEHLPAERLRRYRFAFPPLSEQLMIDNFLDDESVSYAALIRDAHGAITLLQERRSALISAAVTGKIDVRNYKPSQAEPTEEAHAPA